MSNVFKPTGFFNVCLFNAYDEGNDLKFAVADLFRVEPVEGQFVQQDKDIIAFVDCSTHYALSGVNLLKAGPPLPFINEILVTFTYEKEGIVYLAVMQPLSRYIFSHTEGIIGNPLAAGICPFTNEGSRPVLITADEETPVKIRMYDWNTNNYTQPSLLQNNPFVTYNFTISDLPENSTVKSIAIYQGEEVYTDNDVEVVYGDLLITVDIDSNIYVVNGESGSIKDTISNIENPCSETGPLVLLRNNEMIVFICDKMYFYEGITSQTKEFVLYY